jgi:hypothetical protein
MGMTMLDSRGSSGDRPMRLGLACAIGVAVVLGGCSSTKVHPPAGVTFVRGGNTEQRTMVAEFVTRMRAWDVDGVSTLGAGRDSPLWPASYDGARWLVENFSAQLQGVVDIEMRDNEDYPEEHVCLFFGRPRRQLYIALLPGGGKRRWGKHGDDKRWGVAATDFPRGSTTPSPDPRHRFFCDEGEFPPP